MLLQGTSFAIAMDCFTMVEAILTVYSLSKAEWDTPEWVHWNALFLASVYTIEMLAKVCHWIATWH